MGHIYDAGTDPGAYSFFFFLNLFSGFPPGERKKEKRERPPGRARYVRLSPSRFSLSNWLENNVGH